MSDFSGSETSDVPREGQEVDASSKPVAPPSRLSPSAISAIQGHPPTENPHTETPDAMYSPPGSNAVPGQDEALKSRPTDYLSQGAVSLIQGKPDSDPK